MLDLNLIVNGERRDIPHGASIGDVLRRVGIDPARKGIAVAVNEIVVRRQNWETYHLNDEDRIDVIQASQGG